MTEGNGVTSTTLEHPYGAWLGLVDLSVARTRDIARDVERLRFASLWFAEFLTAKEAFTHASVILNATERLVVGTGIANAWARDAAAARAAKHTLADAHPGRFILGLGVGHPSGNQARGLPYSRPLGYLRDYLSEMQSLPGLQPPVAIEAPVVIAALGPQMQTLAREQADGVHTFCTTPAHTAAARARLDEDQLLVPEQAFVIHDDPAAGLEIARAHVGTRLVLPNYVNSFLAMGFDESDLKDGGSDDIVRELVAIGTPDHVASRLAAHLDAGASHVLAHPLLDHDGGVAQLSLLAPVLPLSPGGSMPGRG